MININITGIKASLISLAIRHYLQNHTTNTKLLEDAEEKIMPICTQQTIYLQNNTVIYIKDAISHYKKEHTDNIFTYNLFEEIELMLATAIKGRKKND